MLHIPATPSSYSASENEEDEDLPSLMHTEDFDDSSDDSKFD